MGKYFNKFKNGSKHVKDKILDIDRRGIDKKEKKADNPNLRNENKGRVDMYGEDDFNDDFNEDYNEDYRDDINVQPAQKPESFHHFILENQYKDLERSIRGLKDVWDKETQEWTTKRKNQHCFTDEEAEDILRTAQSHLATDVKLGWIRMEIFGDYMNALYKEIAFLFESIAEYRYGRYGDYDIQYQMKLQNQKIFLELWTRVQSNYSRAVNGQENKYTHESVKGQESLQQTDSDFSKQRGYQ